MRSPCRLSESLFLARHSQSFHRGRDYNKSIWNSKVSVSKYDHTRRGRWEHSKNRSRSRITNGFRKRSRSKSYYKRSSSSLSSSSSSSRSSSRIAFRLNNSNAKYSSSSNYKKYSSQSDNAKKEVAGKFSTDSEMEDDDEGHLVMKAGQLIATRYRIGKLLGEGTFGRVVYCDDLHNGTGVALKVIKAVDKYTEAAMLEIKVLECLSRADPKGEFLCVQALDWFEFKRHMCLSFELMGKSIYEFMKGNDFTAFPFGQVRHIGHQLCTAVKFMHSCGLTHTDLKPENILFVNSDFDLQYSHSHGNPYKVVRNSNIRLIDFGSATFKHEHHTTIVATRHYRALEVILELGWSYPCDVWAIGCILFELYTAMTLFMTHDNIEHLAMMERCLGRLPSWMIRRTRKQKYFYHDHLDWDTESSDGQYVHNAVMPINRYRTCDNQEHTDFFHLIRSMLTYDPHERIKLSEGLEHPFFYSSSCGQKLYSCLPSKANSRSQSRLSSCRRHRYRR